MTEHDPALTDASGLPVGEVAFEYNLVDAGRLYRTIYNRRAQSHHGLTQTQARALIHLARNEGINQARLADILEVQPISLARTLDRLEADAWVERRRDPKDRRAFTLHTLEKAGPVLDDMRDLAHALREELLSSLSQPERQTFVNLLGKVMDNLTETEARDQDLKAQKTAQDKTHTDDLSLWTARPCDTGGGDLFHHRICGSLHRKCLYPR